jgi:hypothetical protein
MTYVVQEGGGYQFVGSAVSLRECGALKPVLDLIDGLPVVRVAPIFVKS